MSKYGIIESKVNTRSPDYLKKQQDYLRILSEFEKKVAEIKEGGEKECHQSKPKPNKPSSQGDDRVPDR